MSNGRHRKMLSAVTAAAVTVRRNRTCAEQTSRRSPAAAAAAATRAVLAVRSCAPEFPPARGAWHAHRLAHMYECILFSTLRRSTCRQTETQNEMDAVCAMNKMIAALEANQMDIKFNYRRIRILDSDRDNWSDKEEF